MSKSERPKWMASVRVWVVAGVIVVVAVLIALIDLRPTMAHLDVQLLAGPAQGNYHVIAKQISARAKARGGMLRSSASQGSVDNLEQLAAAADSCEVQFALVQDGLVAPAGAKLELVARLQKSESVFFIGKDAGKLRSFAELRGLRVGVGPNKSGTDRVARQVLESEDFRGLDLKLSNHGLNEQIELLQRGKLDLGVFVIDEDAALIRNAVRDRQLQLAAFAHWDVVARRYPFFWHGRIGAGQYDPIKLLPPSDRRVLRVDTLVLGNGCASHAQTVSLLSLLSEALPGLVEHNRKRGASGSFDYDPSAKAFFDNEGPDLFEVHLPWLVDIMPPSKWVYIITALSLLFNVMGFGHRFRLWRIDTRRVKLDMAVLQSLGDKLTFEEIHDLQPRPEHVDEQVAARLDTVLQQMSDLRRICRKHAQSMLVPMGQEMGYRFQEDRIEEAVTALRLFRGRLGTLIEVEADALGTDAEQPRG